MARTGAIRTADSEAAPEALGQNLGGLEAIVGLHLRLANNRVFRHFMATLASLDLTQKQTTVLWLIGENPGIAQIDLASRLDMDRATMMALIDRLEARAFVVRTRSKDDRRRQDLNLTKQGRDLFTQQALPALRVHERWLKKRIGDAAEIERFVATLKRIYG